MPTWAARCRKMSWEQSGIGRRQAAVRWGLNSSGRVEPWQQPLLGAGSQIFLTEIQTPVWESPEFFFPRARPNSWWSWIGLDCRKVTGVDAGISHRKPSELLSETSGSHSGWQFSAGWTKSYSSKLLMILKPMLLSVASFTALAFMMIYLSQVIFSCLFWFVFISRNLHAVAILKFSNFSNHSLLYGRKWLFTNRMCVYLILHLTV